MGRMRLARDPFMSIESNEPNHEQPQDMPEQAGEAGFDEQIEQLQAELEQLRAQSLLERADLENQRKRLAREVDNARRFANEKLLADLLPLFDSIEAGLASAAESDPLRAGLELTRKQLLDVAAKNGMQEIAPGSGDAFDPEHHQAMSLAAADGVASGAVVQLFQKGYVLNGRLLRPAMVVVAP